MTSTLEPDEIPDADLDRVAGGTGVLASNNAAILAQRPTFLSILQDNGTGTPPARASSSSGTQTSSAAAPGNSESA